MQTEQTQVSPPTTRERAPTKGRSPGWMWPVIAALAVAVLALGASLVYVLTTAEDEVVVTPPQPEALVDRFVATWNNGGPEDFARIYAPDASMRDNAPGMSVLVLQGRSDIHSMAADGWMGEVRRIGPVTGSGDTTVFPATFFAEGGDRDAVVTLRTVDGKIVEQRILWLEFLAVSS